MSGKITNHWTIREAQHKHIDFLASFGRQSFIDSYKCTLALSELDKYTRVAFAPSTISNEIDSDTVVYYVCEDSERHAGGYAKLVKSEPPDCIPPGDRIELQRLYVEDRFRGQGIGQLLEERCEQYALEQGMRSIWLRVWDGNEQAVSLYEKWSYTTVGDAPYPVGDDVRRVLIMRKPLSRG